MATFIQNPSYASAAQALVRQTPGQVLSGGGAPASGRVRTAGEWFAAYMGQQLPNPHFSYGPSDSLRHAVPQGSQTWLGPIRWPTPLASNPGKCTPPCPPGQKCFGLCIDGVCERWCEEVITSGGDSSGRRPGWGAAAHLAPARRHAQISNPAFAAIRDHAATGGPQPCGPGKYEVYLGNGRWGCRWITADPFPPRAAGGAGWSGASGVSNPTLPSFVRGGDSVQLGRGAAMGAAGGFASGPVRNAFPGCDPPCPGQICCPDGSCVNHVSHCGLTSPWGASSPRGRAHPSSMAVHPSVGTFAPAGARRTTVTNPGPHSPRHNPALAVGARSDAPFEYCPPGTYLCSLSPRRCCPEQIVTPSASHRGNGTRLTAGQWWWDSQRPAAIHNPSASRQCNFDVRLTGTVSKEMELADMMPAVLRSAMPESNPAFLGRRPVAQSCCEGLGKCPAGQVCVTKTLSGGGQQITECWCAKPSLTSNPGPALAGAAPAASACKPPCPTGQRCYGYCVGGECFYYCVDDDVLTSGSGSSSASPRSRGVHRFGARRANPEACCDACARAGADPHARASNPCACSGPPAPLHGPMFVPPSMPMHNP